MHSRMIVNVGAALMLSMVLLPAQAIGQWNVEGGTASACVQDALQFIACVRVHGPATPEAQHGTPWIEIDAESRPLWLGASASVDGGEVFRDGDPQTNGVSWGRVFTNVGRREVERFIAALRAGNVLHVVGRPRWEYRISLRGSAAAIDKALSATWTVAEGWQYRVTR